MGEEEADIAADEGANHLVLIAGDGVPEFFYEAYVNAYFVGSIS